MLLQPDTHDCVEIVLKMIKNGDDIVAFLKGYERALKDLHRGKDRDDATCELYRLKRFNLTVLCDGIRELGSTAPAKARRVAAEVRKHALDALPPDLSNSESASKPPSDSLARKVQVGAVSGFTTGIVGGLMSGKGALIGGAVGAITGAGGVLAKWVWEKIW